MKKRKKMFTNFYSRLLVAIGGIVLICTLGAAVVLRAFPDLSLVAQLAKPKGHPVNQFELLDLIKAGKTAEAFTTAFDDGDRFFTTEFNALDGVGANVGLGMRFTRVPRADLNGPEEWASQVPPRSTGPNGEACVLCHHVPVDDGAGNALDNNHKDPGHTAQLDKIITRQPPHFFGAGGLQLLAEDMTSTLQRIRDETVSQACTNGSATRALTAQGVSFGVISATRVSTNPCKVNIDTSGVVGVGTNLVVKPFTWKGITNSTRNFVRGSSLNELGMQAVELVGLGVDGDFDGVANEVSIGDMTVMAIYIAAQPRPVTKLELSALGLLDPPLTAAEVTAINHGSQVFNQVSCASCHKPSSTITNKIFSEPSQNKNYRDATFPAGQDPISEGVDPAFPLTFDITRDQPDNIVFDTKGNIALRLGSFQVNSQGQVVIQNYSDLKWHDMGPGLAEPIDEGGISSPSNFKSANLWGIGSTPPYMHDGRATTLAEAILAHGGEAANARTAFIALPESDQKDLIAFLENLILFNPPNQDTNPLVINGTPTPTPTPTLIPTPTPTQLNVVCDYNIVSDWGNGATVNMTITNNDSRSINGWTITWTFPGNQCITGLWNGTYTQSGNIVTVRNISYTAAIAANGGSVSLGFNLSYTGTNAKPAYIAVNGVPAR